MSRGILAEDLADALWGNGEPAGEYHARGVVTSVSGSKASIRIRGSDPVSCTCMASYSPSVGDIALVLVMPGGCIALGKVG